MKQICVGIIGLYQKILSPFLHQLLGASSFCRYRPSCSEYAKEAIQKQGVFLGGLSALYRIARCNPFVKAER